MKLSFSLSSVSEIQKILQHGIAEKTKIQDLHFSEDGNVLFENSLNIAITFTSTKNIQDFSVVIEFMADICSNKQIVQLLDTKLADHVDFKTIKEDILSQLIANKSVCAKILININEMATVVSQVDDLVLVNNVAMLIITLKNEEEILTKEKVIVEVHRKEGKIFRTIQNHLVKL